LQRFVTMNKLRKLSYQSTSEYRTSLVFNGLFQLEPASLILDHLKTGHIFGVFKWSTSLDLLYTKRVLKIFSFVQNSLTMWKIRFFVQFLKWLAILFLWEKYDILYIILIHLFSFVLFICFNFLCPFVNVIFVNIQNS
jgi:hypothetical protein